MDRSLVPLSRRRFVLGAGVAGLGLLAGCGRLPGQREPTVYRVGWLDTNDTTGWYEAFQEGMRERGYIEGQNLVIEARRAPPEAEDQVDRLAELAAELVRLPVDVIVAVASAAPLAAKAVTSTIPIVMGTSADPVGAGLVASLARPGGNVTGLSGIAPQLSRKRLELLKETLPGPLRVAVLWTPANPGTVRSLDETQAAAQVLQVQVVALEVRDPDHFEQAFHAASDERATAFVVLSDPLFSTYRSRIVDLAAKTRLPAMYPNPEYVRAGGLMAYGVNIQEQYRRAAYYVDRILQGTKPADLPVEQPMRFDLVINVKTAQVLGLTIPDRVLLQATELIQ